jgi:acetoin utilization deacetylase AcuC-like enzyme
MAVTEQGFARLTAIIMEMAEAVCDGRVVMTLEGGYNLEGEALSVKEVVRQLAGKGTLDRGKCEKEEAEEYPRIKGIVKVLREHLSPFWSWEGEQ